MRHGRTLDRVRWTLPLAILSVGCASGAMLETRRITPGLSAPVEGIAYYLPKKLIRIHVWSRSGEDPAPAGDPGTPAPGPAGAPAPKAKPIRFATFTNDRTCESLIPDLRHHYVIVPQWDPASKDHLEVSLTTDGLLREVGATATDERSGIFQGILDLGRMVATGMPKTKAMTDSAIPRLCAQYEFDPVDPVDFARVRGELWSAHGITVTLTRQPNCPVATSGADCCTTCDATQPGIYYRLPIPYRLTLKPAGLFRLSPAPVPDMTGMPPAPPPGEWDYLDSGAEWTVLLPNEAVCMFVPVSRAAFVERKTTLSFEKGMLTKVVTDKPSELLAFVKIPVDAVSTILATPAELLTFRIKQIDQGRDLSKAQELAAAQEEARLKAQFEALKAGNALRAAQPDAAGGTHVLPALPAMDDQ